MFLEQQISMWPSEGSCDTEDWSTDAENSHSITGINYILKYIQKENISILLHYWSNNYRLANIRDFFVYFRHIFYLSCIWFLHCVYLVKKSTDLMSKTTPRCSRLCKPAPFLFSCSLGSAYPDRGGFRTGTENSRLVWSRNSHAKPHV